MQPSRVQKYYGGNNKHQGNSTQNRIGYAWFQAQTLRCFDNLGDN
jgi:hypothetical protein